MRKRFLLPSKQRESVAKFLAHVDEIREMPAGLHALAATEVKEGKVTLLLSPQWDDYSDDVKREILAHEAGHVALQHVQRMLPLIEEGLDKEKPEDRAAMAQRWRVAGAVIDCSLHYNKVCDWEFVDKELGWQSNTFERLEIPPLPPEIAFHLMMQRQTPPQPCCGTLEVSSCDNSIESQDRALAMAIDVGASLAGNKSYRRGNLTETLPPVPKWITQVIDLLLEKRGRMFRKRSWRRESRTEVPLVPGVARQKNLDCLIMVDASGSTHEHLPTFLAAVTTTPELKGSEVIVFDTTESELIPASNYTEVAAAVKERGGGTSIRKAGLKRISGRAVVWLTDADSFDGMPDPHDAMELWVLCSGDRAVNGKKIVIEK